MNCLGIWNLIPLPTSSEYYSGAVIIWSLALSFAIMVYQQHIHNELLISKERFNGTKVRNQDIMVYVRVPKAGSSLMNHIMHQLSRIHNYTPFEKGLRMPERVRHNGEYIFEPIPNLRKMLVDSILNVNTRPIVYSRHQNFLDFTEFYPNNTQPIVCSFVRDPVERQISWYYYQRSHLTLIDKDENGDLKLNQRYIDTLNHTLKEPLEDCILLKRPHCQWVPANKQLKTYFRASFIWLLHTIGSRIHNSYHVPEFMSQISFFCGHHPDCDMFESKSMFNRAVRNFEHWFIVTGVLEHLNESMLVMETFLPRYFKGASQYLEKINHNSLQPPVSFHVREEIAKNMTHEIEFYNIVRQKLIKQYLSITEL